MNNLSNSGQYSCNSCGKKYTRKSSYKKHIILCDLKESNHEYRCSMEESTDVPTTRELYNIIQELGMKYNKIETELEELKRWVNNKRNKIDIVSWLNTNKCDVDMIVYDWVNTLVVNNEDIQSLFKGSVVDTIIQLLSRHIQEERSIPIFNSSDKPKNLYIYALNEIEGEDSIVEWKLASMDDFMSIIRCIHKKITIGMRDWYKLNKIEINNNEKLDDLYNKSLLKIMNVELQPGSRFISKMKTEICSLLKIE